MFSRNILMVLALLFGIIGLAIPKFVNIPEDVKLDQVRMQLRQIALQEEAYKEVHGNYIGPKGGRVENILLPGESDSNLFIKIKKESPYSYRWTEVTPDSWRVIAIGNLNESINLDIWEVNQTGMISHITSD